MLQNIKQAYEILGVSEYAAKEEVKKAYRTLCKKFHPDRNPAADAVRHYIEVQQAYELIMQMEQYREKIAKVSCHSNTQFSEGGKILGGTPAYMRKYEEMQQRNVKKRKLEREREAQRKEKERKEREELAARIKLRKLPSEKEAERREKIAVQKEAERIAGIIEKLMKL